jgi:hypothetical protein
MPSGYVQGALVAGWPAHVIDAMLSRYLPQYLGLMTKTQRAEVERAHAAIHRAASLGTVAADGNAAIVGPAAAADSEHADELTVDQVADQLGVRPRQARNFAAAWAGEGHARKVGGMWLIDRLAVEAHSQGRQAS